MADLCMMVVVHPIELTIGGEGNFSTACDRLEICSSIDQSETAIFANAPAWKKSSIPPTRSRIEQASPCLFIQCRRAICFPNENLVPARLRP